MKINPDFKIYVMDTQTENHKRFKAEHNARFRDEHSGSCIQLEEKEGEYIISMGVPGLKKKDIQISIQKNMLIISSTQDTGHIDKVVRVDDHCEYELHQLKREFALPSDADGNAASAEWSDERLSIHFPKNGHPYRPDLLKIPVL